MLAPNDSSAVQRAYEVLRKAANANPFPDADEREGLLKRLIKLLKENDTALVDAMSDDFGGRVRFESLSADIMMPIDSAKHAKAHLREWMQRRPVAAHPLYVPGYAFIEPRPLGVVGVISPWNYPVQLALSPVAAAFAAGNRVLLKPSELTPATSALLAKLVAEHFKPDEFTVVTGGPEVAKEVTALPLDHLLFTGSTNIGRHVARAAAENLVPTTLELGGKSPALVHEKYNAKTAATRIAIGKAFNAGQTCIAPDYVLVKKGTEGAFAESVKEAFLKHHPGGEGFTSMINDKAKARMQALVDDAKEKGATVTQTFTAKNGTRAFAPVILTGVTDEMLVMKEEIFGPVLPVETYDTLEDAYARINARPRPLALYYFDDNQDRVDRTLQQVTSGGAAINDTLAHIVQEELPFGGVGPSGMGAYHGVRGFETFTHQRGVMQASRVSPAYNMLTPPVKGLVVKTVEFLIRGLRAL